MDPNTGDWFTLVIAGKFNLDENLLIGNIASKAGITKTKRAITQRE